MEKRVTAACPSCGHHGARSFYGISGAPVHSVLLFASREEALSYPRADVTLAFCSVCGFIWNTAYTGEHIEYSDRYEETQGYSAAFQEFHRALAQRLIDRFELRGKTILEIGCGKRGEFLHLLCDLGDNRGLGFDPVYAPDRDPLADRTNTRFHREFYTEAHRSLAADFVCCKMTLEHVDRPYDFVHMVRTAIGDASDTVVFFQIPEMRTILERRAFWDVYYEHCSYFTSCSLARLFEAAEFTVLDVWLGYGDQYLMIAARPNGTHAAPRRSAEERDRIARHAASFAVRVRQSGERWRRWLERQKRSGRRIVLWGGGSKAVAFLTTLRIDGEIDYVVDINPHRQGTYLPGTADEIVGPEFLTSYRPDCVVVMNPLYRDEIRRELEHRDLRPTVRSVEEPPGD